MGLLENSVDSLKHLIEGVKPIIAQLEGESLPMPVANEIRNYQSQKVAFQNAMAQEDIGNIFESIMYCAMYIQNFASSIKTHDVVVEVSPEVIDELIEVGNNLFVTIQNRPVKLESEEKPGLAFDYQGFKEQIKESDELAKIVKDLSDEVQKVNERVRLENNENIDRINETREKSKSLETDMVGFITKAEKKYEDAILNLSKQKDGLNKLISVKSGDKVAKSYEDSSLIEKKSADILRVFSISFMVMIAVIVGYSFWETTLEEFKWEHSAFRVVLAFFLTVPSAYLARESAKHREQQYLHLQKSLTIRAVDPYISLLPDITKHEIKKEVASYIFNNTKNDKKIEDSFPINNQEVLMALIKKLDLKLGENKNVSDSVKKAS